MTIEILSVGQYLDLINRRLREKTARVQGEIGSVDIRQGYLFFSLKDRDDQGLLPCFMWTRDYAVCGVEFKEGLEVIVEGCSEIYKKSGRFSLRVSSAELVGEGALKQAYEELKKKLENEGLFAAERKKPLPELPQKIGLITSKTGAVIHDFLTNLGKYGFQIKFYDSRVEGQNAVWDLLSAARYFKKQKIDVLVIIRGGGSLESLQAFNNEALVREIAGLRAPVICAIGHDKDVPLAQLAADVMVSTPSIAATSLNKSWDQAVSQLALRKHRLIGSGQAILDRAKYLLMALGSDKILAGFSYRLDQIRQFLVQAEKQLVVVDPRRQLRLGYSLVYGRHGLIRSVAQVKSGERVDIKLNDGKIETKIEKIYGEKHA